ncbi:hypothetical protein HII31_01125, partial [Pseudocercospora fuligena]
MMYHATLAAVLVFALGCLSQEVSDGVYGNTNPDIGSWDFLIVVNDPAIADGCKFTNWVNDSSISIRFDKTPSTYTCFNLQSLQTDIETAKSNGIDLNATIEGQDRFSSFANYSQILFHQGSPNDEIQKGVGYAQLEMYEDVDCKDESRSYVWNCGFPDISCTKLPSGAKSFSIRDTTEAEKEERCVRASLEKTTPFIGGGGKLVVGAW